MAYLTSDEAKERGVAWVARPGEPQDLTDSHHYQTGDESKALGRDWATQPAIQQGRATHAGIPANASMDWLKQLQFGTPDEQNALPLDSPWKVPMVPPPVSRVPPRNGPQGMPMPKPGGVGAQPMPQTPLGTDSDLPPGVPPGSVRINAGINPDLWAYQTPDGRIIHGSHGGGPFTVPGRLPPQDNQSLVQLMAFLESQFQR